MSPDTETCGWQDWFFNPFHFIAGGRALAIGLAVVIVASLNGSVSRTHLDGVFDAHTGAAAPLWIYPIEGLVDWLVMGTAVWMAGRIVSKSRFRALDVYGTQALARFPTLILVLVPLLPGFQRQLARLMAQDSDVVVGDVVSFTVGLIVTVVMMVWMVALMYRAYAVSCNVQGRKAVVAFIIACLAAEAASKGTLMAVFRRVLS
ncbi:MAG TPA: hypothetical protein PLO37_05455 [Candidatus Hydrogenedentes bacterium]|nr:hypothetical protein [Candidatus Hydrogenedentota bacterium]HPG66273.1 hypothetical protein [Candidatus Hydrogenedentota bacterium]